MFGSQGIFSLILPAVLLLSSLVGNFASNGLPLDQIPVASNDNFTLNLNSQLTISAPGVLFNDTTSRGSLVAIKLTDPGHGTLSLDGDGSFVYTPDLNYSGMDSFTYKVNNGLADSIPAVVYLTIDPINDLAQPSSVPAQPSEFPIDGTNSLFGISVTTISPVNGAVDVATSPNLIVNVTDAANSSLEVSFYGRQKTSLAASNFTVVSIPDTQFYTVNTGGYVYFNAMTTWMANNQNAQNIVFVTHTGDITQNGDNDTDNSEWTIADYAMSILERDPFNPMDDVPYSISPGNHESLGSIGGVLARYDAFFPISRFEGKPFYGGHYGTNNDNSYSLFNASGMHFIVINLACTSTSPTTGVLSWAGGLLKDDVSRRGIVVCHNAMDSSGAFTSVGLKVFNALKDNPNWSLLLCGHSGVARRVDQGSDGHSIYSLEADYEGYTNGGNGFFRLMQFQPANNQIQVVTYSPTLNNGAGGYDTAPESQFVLSYSMKSPDFNLIGKTTVPSGSDASITWSGLASSTEYEWYAVARNATNNSAGDVQSFTTTANASGTSTPTATNTPIQATSTPTRTATPTLTGTSSPWTSTPTYTATPTMTGTPGPATSTPTRTATPSGSQVVAFQDNFDPITETWTHYAAIGTDDWGPATAYSHSPTTSFFSSDPAVPKDDYLLTRPILIPENATLSFWHTYKTETGYDGSVIEISIDGGNTYTDLGSQITQGMYTGTISASSTNPIKGRSAWTGNVLGVWSQVVVDLRTYAGQTATIRFRMTADNGADKVGWYIDDVSLVGTNPTPVSTATQTSTNTPTPTPTLSPTSTSTPLPTATFTTTATGTATPTATYTSTSTPTATSTPTPTSTSTNTPLPTATSTITPLPSDTPTSTSTPTATSTGVPPATQTPTFTATASSTPTPTSTSTNTPLPTATHTATFTATASSTPTPTSTATNTPIPTATNTPTYTPTPSYTPTPTQTPIVVFEDNFDPSVEVWNHSAGIGTDDWQLYTTRSYSPTTSYYSSEPATIKDDYLLTRSILIPTNGQLSFWQTYQLEVGRDGAVIEISTDGGVTFIDLGGRITTGPYNAIISKRYGNPIGGRSAWTGGRIGTWSQVVVDLSDFAGQSVIIRFRLATDNRKAGYGWYIDNVAVWGP